MTVDGAEQAENQKRGSEDAVEMSQVNASQVEDAEVTMVSEDEVAAAAARVIDKLQVRPSASYALTV